MRKNIVWIVVCITAAVSLSACSKGRDNPVYSNVNELIGIWFQSATSSSSDQTLTLTATTWENNDAGNAGCIEAGTYTSTNKIITFSYGAAGGCHGESPGSIFASNYAVTPTTLKLYGPGSGDLIADYIKQNGNAPVADAGFAQNILAGTFVTLDGSASADANGDPLTYSWTQASKPAASIATLSSTTAAKPSFTADIAGTYVFSLIVNNGQVNSSPDSILVTSTPLSSPVLATPYANEGDMQEIRNLFIATSGSPPFSWIHDGLDISPKASLKPFHAACSGRVYWVLTLDDLVNVQIKCNSEYMLEYGFEPQAPGTGAVQLGNMAVVEGEAVSQGDIIGNLYVADPAKAHVHFAVTKNGINVCPELYFSTAARDSILNLVHSNPTFPTADMCYGNVSPTPMVTPYVNESDMAAIRSGFSSEGSASPWGSPHDGFDIYPSGNQKELRSVCSGTVSSVKKSQNATSNWEIEVLIECDKYVPNTSGYFAPFWAQYIFKPMSSDPTDGNTQEARISVSAGQPVAKGAVIGTLHTAAAEAHLHFGLALYRDPAMAALGVPSIPVCPDPHFEPAAKTSMLNLLNITWPGSILCYQN